MFSDPFGLCSKEDGWTGCPLGSESGQQATEFWANKASSATNFASKAGATAMGLFSSLWTPQTATETGMTIVGSSLGSVAQSISRIGAVRNVLNGASVGSSDGLMASLKFNPGERSIAIIRQGERILDVGVHAIGESPLGAGRQVIHAIANPEARAVAHEVTELIGGARFIQ